MWRYALNEKSRLPVGGQINQHHRNTHAKASTGLLPDSRLPAASACIGANTPVSLVGRGPRSHGEDTCTDLVLFMDRTESTEEELNDGQVIIACSNVQTGIACLGTEIKL